MSFFVIIAFLLTQTSFADSNNSRLVLEGKYTLEIPLVDFDGKPGFYQNAVFESVESDQDWKLLSVDEGVPIETLDTVEVIKTQDTPVQVFLRIHGTLSNGCLEPGEFAVDRNGNAFTAFLYFSPASFGPGSCGDVQTAFTRTFPLPVYGLDAGDYSFTVNDILSGQFVIPADNVISE